MDTKTALEKIKKCLALSESANEHEAAGDAAIIIGSRDGKDIQLHHAMNGADGVKRLGNGL